VTVLSPVVVDSNVTSNEFVNMVAGIVPNLAAKYQWRNLTQMRAFYLSRPPETILQTASAKSETPQDCRHRPQFQPADPRPKQTQ